jgi:hypothetical protein
MKSKEENKGQPCSWIKDASGAFCSSDQGRPQQAMKRRRKETGIKQKLKKNHPDATPQFASPKPALRAWHFVPSTHGTNKITLRFPRRTCRYVGVRFKEN